MRILAVADLHGSAEALRILRKSSPDYELLVMAGDITHFGPVDYLRSILSAVDIPVVMVPGNCDPPGILDVSADNLHQIHRRRAEIAGMGFAGLGGAIAYFFSDENTITEDEILQVLGGILKEGDVLVTHQPARGFNDAGYSGENTGSVSLRMAVDERKPALHISGHIHEAYGIMRNENTVFVNPGPLKNGRYADILLDNDEILAELHKE